MLDGSEVQFWGERSLGETFRDSCTMFARTLSLGREAAENALRVAGSVPEMATAHPS